MDENKEKVLQENIKSFAKHFGIKMGISEETFIKMFPEILEQQELDLEKSDYTCYDFGIEIANQILDSFYEDCYEENWYDHDLEWEDAVKIFEKYKVDYEKFPSFNYMSEYIDEWCDNNAE